MNKRERFYAAVRGEKIDRPPVTAWVHFLSDHLSGEQTAALHRCFAEAYDWDVVKVMNDYRYPIPAGVHTLEIAIPDACVMYTGEVTIGDQARFELDTDAMFELACDP